uniref:Putative odorant-binding protein 56e obp obp n=1 Tax=Lutzomyia longipalpis TaxID=7200 RepID=A0A1B0C832_LUTLO
MFAHGIEIPSSMMSNLLSCGKDSGITAEDLLNVYKGNFSVLTKFNGCIIDCFTKKIGLLSEDNKLNNEDFKKRVSGLFNAEHSEKLFDECSAKATTTECEASAPSVICSVIYALVTAFS